MGIHTNPEGAMDEGIATNDSTPVGSLSPPVHPAKDPLWLLSKEEAIRLTRVYEEVSEGFIPIRLKCQKLSGQIKMGIMYPFLDIEKTIRHTSVLYSFIGAATRSGLTRVDHPGADGLGDDDTNILKMVLATALMAEGSGRSSLGARLFETVKKPIERSLWSPQVDMKGLVLLALTVRINFFYALPTMATIY
jgi:hypothetical protein